MQKKATKAPAKAPVEAAKPTPRKTEGAAKAAPKAAKAKGGSQLVMVKNLRKTFFRQPSTGIRINALETKELKDDGWLELQCQHKILERV